MELSTILLLVVILQAISLLVTLGFYSFTIMFYDLFIKLAQLPKKLYSSTTNNGLFPL
jgi:hypothetical protein